MLRKYLTIILYFLAVFNTEYIYMRRPRCIRLHTSSSAMEWSYLHQRTATTLLFQTYLLHVPNSHSYQKADGSLTHQTYHAISVSELSITMSSYENPCVLHCLYHTSSPLWGPPSHPASTLLASLFSIYFILSCIRFLLKHLFSVIPGCKFFEDQFCFSSVASVKPYQFILRANTQNFYRNRKESQKVERELKNTLIS